VYVELRADMERRVDNILSEYAEKEGWEEEARKAIHKIRKYLGPQRFALASDLFEKGRYREVVRFLMEEYYDKRYRQFGKPVMSVDCNDVKECVTNLKKFYTSLTDEVEVQNTYL
jgi:hypothetical protein